ncbi:MerR family transcriptional regulator [Flavobacteriaceae bacterium]|jgi:DNA-binding transcriptional MerR regulator|nr:MerR family transcriptional regulator [Cryomorphaceae bacterium]MDB3967616.1 MerR family transcriptional regulator [Flavobacteriaceae bacterium]MBT3503515.1 MerR family transcriptional regulator [Cryomorphaceae bacterium]MBT3689578.1 MerR family transcriptional regulator [Cryomorphaceae bacterium]MBT4221823.1 MerR family transcriptional regulator [Cryomorphaceae bacterium]|tara:strand:- start:83 stop:412 length:330 start_codon:yes stop_codon:yes gene_type:complete
MFGTLPEKKYYSISEVAIHFNVNTSLLRYWEKEFDQINPLIKSSGIRKFTRENIETISLIYTMLKKDGLTIQGAKKKLKSKDISDSENLTILKKLNKIKEELRSLKNNL